MMPMSDVQHLVDLAEIVTFIAYISGVLLGFTLGRCWKEMKR